MLARLLCRYGWYRRLMGGQWSFREGRWIRIQIEVVEPYEFFVDDASLREDVVAFLTECEKHGQRDRS